MTDSQARERDAEALARPTLAEALAALQNLVFAVDSITLGQLDATEERILLDCSTQAQAVLDAAKENRNG